MTGKDFIKGMKVEVLRHPVMSHPFWGRFEKGACTREGLRRFALHYYLQVLRARLYDARVLSRTPSETIQAALARIIWNEYGCGNPEKTHPAQFRKLLKALGLQENDWTSVNPLPELEVYSDVHTRLCSDYDVWVGLGVVGPAMEYPIPVLYSRLVQGFYNVGLSKEALEFFLEHTPTDEIHSSLMENVLLPYLDREDRQTLLREGVRRSLDARNILMDGMERVTFG
ncbi:MAG: iron-containing redox enzyme family protein [Nitrospirae bacterium]|nr:iron-containing redox enzyme family protein [Nitrospirota bacterium]